MDVDGGGGGGLREEQISVHSMEIGLTSFRRSRSPFSTGGESKAHGNRNKPPKDPVHRRP